MYNYEIKPSLKNILTKLLKKDRTLCEQVMKKVDEIINSLNIEHYKNLRYEMKDFKRVRVEHFVLIFKYDKSADKISFDDFDHHDNIYKR